MNLLKQTLRGDKLGSQFEHYVSQTCTPYCCLTSSREVWLCREFEAEIQDRAQIALAKSTQLSSTQGSINCQKQLPASASVPITTTNDPIVSAPISRSSLQNLTAKQRLIQVSAMSQAMRNDP